MIMKEIYLKRVFIKMINYMEKDLDTELMVLYFKKVIMLIIYYMEKVFYMK